MLVGVFLLECMLRCQVGIIVACLDSQYARKMGICQKSLNFAKSRHHRILDSRKFLEIWYDRGQILFDLSCFAGPVYCYIIPSAQYVVARSKFSSFIISSGLLSLKFISRYEQVQED
jgi:hypothetical protein